MNRKSKKSSRMLVVLRSVYTKVRIESSSACFVNSVALHMLHQAPALCSSFLVSSLQRRAVRSYAILVYVIYEIITPFSLIERKGA